ncbi:hypothetical protein CDAR_538911 [Caerostris darwini]|uniref:Uncharacterized protein n=1 Tax=Caerostris darwini TaxID=1538125 RepID=A0AAV4SYG6_9ARAC|nr:hypothetical protein CDAR_538911 [Caerostris darwini]
MPLLSRYSRDGSSPGPPVCRMPGLHQIKIFSLSLDRSVKKFHLFSLGSFSTPFSSDVIKSAQTNNFVQRGGGRVIKSPNPDFLFFFSFLLLLLQKEEENLGHLISEISFAPPDLQNLLQSPTGFKTVWNRSSLTSEINRSSILECVTGRS